MTLAQTNAVVARIQTVPALTSKTFKLVATRDSAGKLPVAPYVVVQPSDGTDTQSRYTGPKSEKHPRIVLHVVGSSYDNAQKVTELVKDVFVVRGVGIQLEVTGEKSRGLRIESPLPTQKDDDVTPPLIWNTLEVFWDAEPLPV